jgi:hypothetical protein
MGADSKINSLALHDILISLADSLKQAQSQLDSVPPFDEFGRPNVIYHLPYLDFNLKVVSEFETQADNNNIIQPSRALISKALVNGPSLLRFRPQASQLTAGQNRSTTIDSTISGRFLAVIPNEGLPRTDIIFNISNISKTGSHYQFDINVTLVNSNNEKISNAMVEVNFDQAESNNMNTTDLVTSPVFSRNEGLTDGNGNITVTVKISETDYLNGRIFCFTINTGNVFKFISFSKQ